MARSRDFAEKILYEYRRHREPHPARNLSRRTQLRRWYWIFVRTHDGEMCGRCGRPVARSCPSYWRTDDQLWAAIVDPTGVGIRCVPCFTLDAGAAGRPVSWRAVEGDVEPLDELLDAVRPILAAHKSEQTVVTFEQVTRAWAAFDAVRSTRPTTAGRTDG